MARDDVAGAGAGVDVGHLPAGRRKKALPRPSAMPASSASAGRQVDRVPRQMRVGDVACTPLTVSLPDSEPRRPFLTMSPERSTEVGSPTMQASSRTPAGAAIRPPSRCRRPAGPSSSLVSRKASEPAVRPAAGTNSSVATTIAASEVFMSAAPRPYSRPVAVRGHEGSLRHCSSGRWAPRRCGRRRQRGRRVAAACERPTGW